MIDPHFHTYIGKELYSNIDEIGKKCKAQGLSCNVLDGTAPNIDVDHKRMNLLVDDSFKITKIWIG